MLALAGREETSHHGSRVPVERNTANSFSSLAYHGSVRATPNERPETTICLCLSTKIFNHSGKPGDQPPDKHNAALAFVENRSMIDGWMVTDSGVASVYSL